MKKYQRIIGFTIGFVLISMLQKSGIALIIEANFRGAVTLLYDLNQNKSKFGNSDIYITDINKEDFKQKIDSLELRYPKLILINWELEDDEIEYAKNFENIIFPLQEEDVQPTLSIGNLTIGFRADDEFNNLLVKKLGLVKRWYNSDDVPIRFLGQSDSFNFCKDSNIPDNKIIILTYKFDSNSKKFSLSTASGLMHQDILISNGIFSLVNYGLEISSVFFDFLAIAICIFSFYSFTNNRSEKFWILIITFVFHFVIFISLSFFLFIIWNIFIHPVFILLLPLLIALDYIAGVVKVSSVPKRHI